MPAIPKTLYLAAILKQSDFSKSSLEGPLGNETHCEQGVQKSLNHLHWKLLKRMQISISERLDFEQ